MQSEDTFPFNTNDVVLVDWERKLYYAKILSINHTKSKCRILFDDGSCGNAHFSQIHNVNETTADIHCVVCKEDSTSPGNEIVLCDSCSVGYHQRCHNPRIPADALEYFSPWICSYCSKEESNPHIEKNPFEEKQENSDHDKEINLVKQNSLNIVEAIHQGQVSDCEANGTDSGMAMREGYRNHAQRFGRDLGDNYRDGRKYDREIVYSRNGEKRSSNIRPSTRCSLDIIDRRPSESSSYHRRRSAPSPPEYESESRKENWRRRNRYENDFDRNWKNRPSSNDSNSGMKPGGKRSFHEGKCNDREFTRHSSRGSKHQRTRLRDKLAKRYIPNQYLYGFSNKIHTRTSVVDKHNTNNNGKEIKENTSKQKRPRDSHDGKINVNKNNGKIVFNSEEPCNQIPNSTELHAKRARLDSERLNKIRNDIKKSVHEQEKRSEHGTINGVSENHVEMRNHSEIVSRSAVSNETEVSREPLASKTMEAITVEGSKGNGKDIERISRVLEDQDVDNRREEERSAFKYVKECLFSRPGSSIKHQQELTVNYKNTITFCNDKVAQCKHSDAAEFQNECASSSAEEKCTGVEGATAASVVRSVGYETCSLNTPSLSNIDKVRKEDGVGLNENLPLQTFVNTLSTRNDEGSETRFVMTDALVQRLTVEDTVTRAGGKTTEKVNCVPSDDNGKAVSMDVNGMGSINAGLAMQQTANGTAQFCQDATSSAIRSSDSKALLLLGDKHDADMCNANSSCSDYCLDIKTNKDEKPDGNSNSFNVDDLAGCVMKKEAALSQAGAEYLPNANCKSTTSDAESYRGEGQLNLSTNDHSNAHSTPMKSHQNRSLSAVSSDRCEMDIGKKHNRLGSIICQPGIHIVEPEVKSPNSESERKEIEEETRNCNMDIKSSVSDASRHSSSSSVSCKGKECVSTDLLASSANDLIVEWVDNNDNESFLGIRISDVFSLKKENVDGERNGDKCVAKEASDLENVSSEVKKDSSENVLHGLRYDQNESERPLSRRDGLVNEHLEELNSSELFGCNSSNKRKEILEANDELHKETCHADEAGTLKRGLESSGCKTKKTDAKETAHLDDSLTSLDCRSDQSTKRKRRKRKTREFVGTFDMKQTDRLLLDLPRHNWLIERLLSEKKLDSDIIEEEKPCEASQECEKKPKSSKRKKKNDHSRASESDTVKSPGENLEVDVELYSSKSIDSNEENDDVGEELIGSIDILCNSKTDKISIAKGKENDAANIESITTVEQCTERSSKQCDSKIPTSNDTASKNDSETKYVSKPGSTTTVEKFTERSSKQCDSKIPTAHNIAKKNDSETKYVSKPGSTTTVEKCIEGSTKQFELKMSSPNGIANQIEIETKCVSESGGTNSPGMQTDRVTQELCCAASNAAVHFKDKIINNSKSGTVSPFSLKISTPDNIIKEKEITTKSMANSNTSLERAEFCKVGCSDSLGVNSQALNSNSCRNTDAIRKKDSNQFNERAEDLPEVVLAGRIYVPQNKTVERDVNRSIAGTRLVPTITNYEDDSAPEMSILIAEDSSRSRDDCEVKNVTTQLCKERHLVNNENLQDNSLSIHNRIVIGTKVIMSTGNSVEGKDERKSIMVDLPTPVRHHEIDVNCTVDNLDPGLLAPKESKLKSSKHGEEFESSIQEHDLLQKDVSKHSHTMPHILPITLGSNSHDKRRHSTSAEDPSYKQSYPVSGNTRCSFSERPEVTNARQRAPIMSNFSNSFSSNTTSVLQYRNVDQATGYLPQKKSSSAQHHEQLLLYERSLKNPSSVSQRCSVDRPDKAPVGLKREMNDDAVNRTSVPDSTASNTHQERLGYAEKTSTGINERRSRMKASLDEKAKIILSIIEDKSISDSTKQELVGYWRSIRNIRSHSGSDRLPGGELNGDSHEASHCITSVKMSSSLRHSVYQDNPGLNSSKEQGLSPSPLNSSLINNDNHSIDLPVALAEQICDVPGRLNVQQHISRECCPQRVSPTLSRHEKSNLSNSTELYRERGFNRADRPSSDSTFLYMRSEESHRRRVKVQEMADHQRHSPKSSRFVFDHHIHPENNLPHRTDSNSNRLDLSASKVTSGLTVKPDTTFIRSPTYRHFSSDINAPQGEITDRRLPRLHVNVGDIRDKSPRPENHSNRIHVMMDHSRRRSITDEQELLFQKRIEYLSRKGLNVRPEVALAHMDKAGQHFLNRDNEKARIDAGHKFLRQQHLQQQVQKIISQQPPQRQPNVDHVTLLPAQQTEHLKQPILQKQLQLQHQKSWQQDLQHHFNHQRKMQPPTIQRPQQIEQKYPQKNDQLMDLCRPQQDLQRERIIIREEPHDMKECRQQKMGWQKVEERRHSLDEFLVEKQLSFEQYRRCKASQQQQSARNLKKCFEDGFFSRRATFVDNGQQQHLHVPPQLQPPFRPQAQGVHQPNQVCRSPEKVNHKNPSPIACYDAKLRTRDTSPGFDVVQHPIRQAVGCKRNGHIFAASCQSCGNKATLLCSRCRGAMYCSEKCQFKEWQEHRKLCESNHSNHIGQEAPRINQWHQTACN